MTCPHRRFMSTPPASRRRGRWGTPAPNRRCGRDLASRPMPRRSAPGVICALRHALGRGQDACWVRRRTRPIAPLSRRSFRQPRRSVNLVRRGLRQPGRSLAGDSLGQAKHPPCPANLPPGLASGSFGPAGRPPCLVKHPPGPAGGPPCLIKLPPVLAELPPCPAVLPPCLAGGPPDQADRCRSQAVRQKRTAHSCGSNPTDQPLQAAIEAFAPGGARLAHLARTSARMDRGRACVTARQAARRRSGPASSARHRPQGSTDASLCGRVAIAGAGAVAATWMPPAAQPASAPATLAANCAKLYPLCTITGPFSPSSSR